MCTSLIYLDSCWVEYIAINLTGHTINSRNNIAFIADDREDFAHMLYYLKDLDIKFKLSKAAPSHNG